MQSTLWLFTSCGDGNPSDVRRLRRPTSTPPPPQACASPAPGCLPWRPQHRPPGWRAACRRGGLRRTAVLARMVATATKEATAAVAAFTVELAGGSLGTRAERALEVSGRGRESGRRGPIGRRGGGWGRVGLALVSRRSRCWRCGGCGPFLYYSCLRRPSRSTCLAFVPLPSPPLLPRRWVELQQGKRAAGASEQVTCNLEKSKRKERCVLECLLVPLQGACRKGYERHARCEL